MNKLPPNNTIVNAFISCNSKTWQLQCPINFSDFTDLITDSEKLDFLNKIKRKIIDLYVHILGDVGIVKFDYEI